MNELYEKTLEIDGKTYRYDPDYDCYYRSHPLTPDTWHERVISIVGAILLLIMICIVVPPVLEWLK